MAKTLTRSASLYLTTTPKSGSTSGEPCSMTRTKSLVSTSPSMGHLFLVGSILRQAFASRRHNGSPFWHVSHRRSNLVVKDRISYPRKVSLTSTVLKTCDCNRTVRAFRLRPALSLGRAAPRGTPGKLAPEEEGMGAGRVAVCRVNAQVLTSEEWASVMFNCHHVKLGGQTVFREQGLPRVW